MIKVVENSQLFKMNLHSILKRYIVVEKQTLMYYKESRNANHENEY
jgi:hypothetical protein